MLNVLLGLIFGFLTLVHSSPVGAVTQSPAKTEHNVAREAEMDGFLIDPTYFPSITPEPPKRNITVQPSQQLSPEQKTEISGSGDAEETATQYPTLEPDTGGSGDAEEITGQNPTIEPDASGSGDTEETTGQNPTIEPDASGSGDAEETTTQNPTTEPDASGSGDAEETTTQNPTSEPDETENSGSGESGDESSTSEQFDYEYYIDSSLSPDTTFTATISTTPVPCDTEPPTPSEPSTIPDTTFTATISTTPVPCDTESPTPSEPSTESTSATAAVNSRMFGAKDMSKEMSEELPIINEEIILADNVQDSMLSASRTNVEDSGKHASDQEANGTPGWVIILGFVAGVAAMIMVCVAIATRDKWNAPNQAPQMDTKVNSPLQQSEQEMETFLQKEEPRENGQEAEYTVIPLDDLPERSSFH